MSPSDDIRDDMRNSVRKSVISIETIHHDGGPRAAVPLRIGSIAAVIANPFAGRYEPDLLPFMELLKPLATQMSHDLLAALQVAPAGIEVFGKGAIVGTVGELEHAALWHACGHGMRAMLGAKGFVTSGKMMGALGARLQVPLVYVNSTWVRSHFNTIEVSVSDAPKPRELVFILAMGTGGRLHARVGGMTRARADAGEVPKGRALRV